MSKICGKCGGVVDDNAAFCPYCGDNQNNYAQQQYYQQVQQPVQQLDDHTGIGGWIGWLALCSFLPVIGAIIAICCSNDKSVKNWAIASLIIGAILIVLLIIVAIILFSLVYSYAPFYYH